MARQNASRWHAGWRQGGLQALRSAGPTGPDPRLSDAQLAAIGQALHQGARAHGFDTDHWTLARVATVIEQVTGVAYHPGHVWKLLRHGCSVFAGDTLEEVIAVAEHGIQRIRHTHHFAFSFLRHSGLSLW